MIGVRVRIDGTYYRFLKDDLNGTVVAESERCLGVRLDGTTIPVIVRKNMVMVLTAS